MSDTKQEIMNVAMQLFAKKGYHSTSIRDITSAAKMNSSMVSYYFQSKENLYVVLFESFYHNYQNEFQNNEAILKKDFAAFLRQSIKFSFQNKCIFSILIFEQINKTSKKVSQLMNEMYLHHLSMYIRMYDQIKNDINTNDSNLMNWKYHTFFNNLKNHIVALNTNEDRMDLITSISSIRFIENSIEQIFNIKYSLILQ